MRTDREINLGIAISALNTVIYSMKNRGVPTDKQKKAKAMLEQQLKFLKDLKELESLFGSGHQ